MKAIRTARWGYTIVSIIFCISGILLAVYPKISAKMLCYLMGIFLILYGIIKIIGYFSKDLYCLAFQFDLALGLMCLAIGLIMIIEASDIISFLHFVIGIIIFLDGLFKLQIAVDAKRFGLSKWRLILLISILVCVFGLLLIIRPFKGALLVMRMTGLSLLAEGIMNLCVAVFTVKYFKKNNLETIDFKVKGDRDD